MRRTVTIPRAGQPPRAGIAYRMRPGAYGVLLRGREILLTRQVTSDVDELQLPGGGIDPGEAPLPALIREMREETGYSAIVQRHLGSFRDFTFMPEYGIHAQKICHVFLGRPGLRLGPPSEAGHSAVWMPLLDAVRRVASPGSRAILQRLMD